MMLVLANCSTQISALEPSTGYSAKSPKVAYVHADAGSTLRVATTITLLPGVYRPLGRNASGIWYVGEAGNLRIFYTEKKRSDGKRLLASYTGGVLMPLKPEDRPAIFMIASTEKLWLVSDSSGTEAAPPLDLTLGQFQAQGAINSGTVNPANAALGGAIADSLLAHDAQGLRLLPQASGEPGLATWLEGP
ncbi:hypothetical protein [Variovorax sp.]|uniref:hypothetical protein n=1 Tax=Variovorax sp. TaxID=1871043 RepID=UPI003BAB27EF